MSTHTPSLPTQIAKITNLRVTKTKGLNLQYNYTKNVLKPTDRICFTYYSLKKLKNENKILS